MPNQLDISAIRFQGENSKPNLDKINPPIVKIIIIRSKADNLSIAVPPFL